MHVNFHLLDISFAFSLFFLLSYKIRSLVRAHLIPYLIQQKQALRRRYAEVIEKKKLIASTMVRLDSQIKNQQMEFAFLEKKIDLWHANMRRNQEQLLRTGEALTERLKEKRTRQSQCLTASKLARESMVLAAEAAEKELIKTYAGALGRNYMHQVVTSLNINKSKGQA